MIDPGEQIAVDEQLLVQQSGEMGQAPAEAGAQTTMVSGPLRRVRATRLSFTRPAVTTAKLRKQPLEP